MTDALVEVAFKGNRREFFRWEGDAPPPPRAPVIVEVDRGQDLGRVHTTGALAALRARGVPHGPGDAPPERRVLRVADVGEVQRWRRLRDEEDDTARRETADRARAHQLAMKVTDAEWQWDRRKLTIYFTAEKRVDFRALVRDLAARFRARIELKQIGVRDEAKRLDGVGRCGRQFCSAAWLPELRPVNLGVAKDQRLSLNPTQISGACGRLMCCLRYEHDFYVAARRRFPREGKVLVTARGEEKVLAIDIFRERVTLRGAEGDARVVPLAQLDVELAGGIVEPDLGVAAGDGDEEGELDFSKTQSFVIPVALRRAAPLPTAAAGAAAGGGPAPPAADPAADGAPDEADDDGEGAAGKRKRRRGRRGGKRHRQSREHRIPPGAIGDGASPDVTAAPGDDGAGEGA
jgi:cell fate regulator YaaT (PSP1 superfamily)